MIIVNADDFGMSEDVNRAIASGIARGVLSSATVMANAPAFIDACETAEREGIQDRIGIHINLTEGSPLTADVARLPRFCDAAGRFRFKRNSNWFLSSRERTALECEVRAQIQMCRDRGLTLTHADSHHHVHTEPVVFHVIKLLLQESGIGAVRPSENAARKPFPVALYKWCYNRWLRRSGFACPDFFSGMSGFDAQRYHSSRRPVCWEIMVHPGFDKAGELVDLEDGLPLIPRLRQILRCESPAPYPHGVFSRSAAVNREVC